VTSDEQDSAAILSVAEGAERLEADPTLVSQLVGSLSRGTDAALAGYLATYLWLRVPASRRAVATELLLQMLPNPSVPGEAMEFVAQTAVLGFNGLPASVKSEVVRHFVDLGQRQDVWCARAGYSGLAKIAGFDHEIIGTIPADTLRALGNAYREMVKKGSIKRNEPLEAGLGIRFE
jgi:hypothetical protein